MPPNTPQPGRIAPKAPPAQLPGKISSSTIINPTADRILGGLTEHFAGKDNRNRYRKALAKVHSTDRVPLKPKYRISLFGGGILMAMCLIIDIVDMILAAFLVTDLVVLIIDSIWGILMCAYLALWHRLSFAAHWPRYASLLGAFIGELIPYVDVASFWFLDAWYIVHTIRAEDRRLHQQLLQTVEQERQEQARQDRIEEYQRQQASQNEQEETEME